MLTLQDQGPIFFVFDAIDECPNNMGTPSPRENVLELIEWLSELDSSRLSICVTSRPEADIEAVHLSWHLIRFPFMARMDKRKISPITSSGS
jgi:hypothetical protein